MDLRETPIKDQKNEKPPGHRPPRIPNLGRRIFASAFWMTAFTGLGYLLYSFTKDMGTERNRKRVELEIKQGRRDQTPGKQQMMMDTLLGQGPSSLSELREITTQKRYKIAEENTVYAIPVEEKNSDLYKHGTNESANKVDTNTNNQELKKE